MGGVTIASGVSAVSPALPGDVTASGLTESTGKLLGRSTAGTGALEEITPGTGFSMAAGVLTYVAAPLFVLRGANLQSTADQAFTKVGVFTNYVITKVLAVTKTGGASVACAGGIYTAAAKGGTPLIAAVQSWVTLTGALKIVDATLAAVLATDAQSATPIFSLTTGSTAAATADLFVFGYVVD